MECGKDGKTSYSDDTSVLLQVPGDGLCCWLDAADVGNDSGERQMICLHNKNIKLIDP